MRIFIILACAAIMGCLSDGAASAEKRVALVIGNGDYQYADKLANPVTDARRMREALTKLGFNVVYGENVGKRTLERTIGRFATVAQDSEVALVYFAGHGATFGDVPYVVPIDAQFSSLAEMPYELVRVESLIGELRRATGLRIAILDACRDNTAERELKRKGERGGELTHGLARVQNPEGLILAYATQYMATAADGPANESSPFTAALLNNIATPGLDVKDLFFRVGSEVIAKTRGAQRPEISISFYDSYALMSGSPAPPAQRPMAASFAPASSASPSGPCGGGVLTVSLASRSVQPLSAAEECLLKPKDLFKECDNCPEMVVVPAGTFMMGSPASEQGRSDDEGPQYRVAIERQFAVGRFAVTFEEWDACVADGGCNGYRPGDEGWGRGRRPVINVSWSDARTYLGWLSRKTGRTYRLLSEAEREYVTRAATSSPFWWGYSISTDQANYDGNYTYGVGWTGKFPKQTLPVDSFSPNPWGIYQVHGNVWEWVEDCWHISYAGAPSDGAAWTSGNCSFHVLRGGSWILNPSNLRAAKRYWNPADLRNILIGIRVARTLSP